MSKVTYVRKTSTGYWHVRFGPQIFFQWPRSRTPTLEDGFPEGWVDESYRIAAKAAVEQADNA